MFIDTAEIPVIVRHARCLRMRYNRSECSLCTCACCRDAINLEGGISIDQKSCTGCLLCSVACPTGTLEVRGCDFNGVVSMLAESERPVLGCNKIPRSKAHARVSCLGMLSVEHLVYLGIFLNRPIQLNLTGCRQCDNRSIVLELKKTLATVREIYGIEFAKAVPVESADALDYKDTILDRRGFFRALKKTTYKSAAEIAHGFMSSSDEQVSYSQKSLPDKRKLINRAYLSAGESEKKKLLPLLYDCRVNEDCNICAACVGLCPSGAIKVTRTEDMKELHFLSACCSGCGLCQEFCTLKAIHISQGFQDQDPFVYIGANKVTHVL